VRIRRSIFLFCECSGVPAKWLFFCLLPDLAPFDLLLSGGVHVECMPFYGERGVEAMMQHHAVTGGGPGNATRT